MGVDHDTAEFAVTTIGRWWQRLASRLPDRDQRIIDYRRFRRNATASVCGMATTGTGRPNRPADRSATSHPGPASGTRSSISCSATSPKIGAAGRWHAGDDRQPDRFDNNKHRAEGYARLDDGTYPDKIRVPDEQIQAVNLHDDGFHPGIELHHQTETLNTYKPLAAARQDVEYGASYTQMPPVRGEGSRVVGTRVLCWTRASQRECRPHAHRCRRRCPERRPRRPSAALADRTPCAQGRQSANLGTGCADPDASCFDHSAGIAAVDLPARPAPCKRGGALAGTGDGRRSRSSPRRSWALRRAEGESDRVRACAARVRSC